MREERRFCSSQFTTPDGTPAVCNRVPDHDGNHFGPAVTWEWSDEEADK